MLPRNLLLLALSLAPAALAAPSADAANIKPIFSSWGESVKPFKPGKVGDKWNPPPPSPPIHKPVATQATVPEHEVAHLLPPDPTEKSTVFMDETLTGEKPTSSFVDGQAQAQENTSKNDITRMAASNNVALFNGIPVDPYTGRRMDGAEDASTTPLTDDAGVHLTKRWAGFLKKKLGLTFLDDPNVDDNIIREHMKSAEIGKNLTKSTAEIQAEEEAAKRALEEAAAAEAAAAEAAEEAARKGTDIKPTEQKPGEKKMWTGNSYMVYNGVPTSVDEGKATEKAFDRTDFALQKRSDVRSKLGLGMFEVPGVSGRRKAPSSPLPVPVIQSEAVDEEEQEIEPEPEVEPVYCEPEPEPLEDEELELQDLGKSFVIYNGMPVEINGEACNNKKLKKPRPAFKNRGNDYRIVKRSAGRKYAGLDPFRNNPISGGSGKKDCGRVRDQDIKAQDEHSGHTNSEGTEDQIFNVRSQKSGEEECVRISKGDNYVMFNGQPVVNHASENNAGFNPFAGGA